MRNMVEDMVNDMLDMEGPIKINGSVFFRSDILREMDPIAYSELMSNFADSLISDLQDLSKDVVPLPADIDQKTFQYIVEWLTFHKDDKEPENPAAIHILEKNLDKIHWGYLCENPAAIHIIERKLENYVPIIDFEGEITAVRNRLDRD